MEVPSIFLNKILAETAKKNAVSLHLSVGTPPAMRINEEVVAMENESIITLEIAEKMIASFLREDEKKELAEKREIVLVKVFGGSFRFRVNIFYQKDLPSLSFKYIREGVRKLSDLKLSQLFNNFLRSRSGLFVIAGAQMSGKTSTAVAIIEEINNNYKKHVITIEDPIEYLFMSRKSIIEQRQVGRDVTTVADGVIYCLDEYVDVVYLSEIKREFDDALPVVLELAAGNSLVILEVNAENSVRLAEKMINALSRKMSVEAARHNLADVFLGAISQKLIPKRGGGLALASEIIISNPAIKSLIREGRIYQLESIIQTSREEGMISMEKSIEELKRKEEI